MLAVYSKTPFPYTETQYDPENNTNNISISQLHWNLDIQAMKITLFRYFTKEKLKIFNILSYDIHYQFKILSQPAPPKQLAICYSDLPEPKNETTEPSFTDCHICLCGIDLNSLEYIKLKNCEHIFHKECAKLYLAEYQKTLKLEIFCPEEFCGQIFTIETAQELLTPAEFLIYQYSIHRKEATHQRDKYLFCQTPDCTFIIEKNPDIPVETCVLCQAKYCTACEKPEHIGMTCDEAKELVTDDFKSLELLGELKWKRCDSCKFYIERSEGCHHMTCSCGYEFCYLCGEIWQTCECNEDDPPQQEDEYNQ